MLRILLITLVVAFIPSCARIEVVKASFKPDLDGVHFYRPDLYLLVTAGVDKDGKLNGTNSIQIIPLPNTKEEYIIHPVSGLGTSEMQPTLTDGWNLTALDAKQDSKIPELITALSSLATSVTPKGIAPSGGVPAPPLRQGLYRIEYDASSGQVTKFVPVFFPTN